MRKLIVRPADTNWLSMNRFRSFHLLFIEERCKYCGAPIPPEHEIIETVVFVGMTLIATITDFSIGMLLNIVFEDI